MKPNKRHRPFRNATESVLQTMLGGGHLARLSYRLGGHGSLKVTRHEIALAPGLRLARPLRIAFASDFHAGPTTDPGIFDELLACLEQEAPDVLLLGGDYVSFDAANVRFLRAFLTRSRALAPLGAFAVVGNHDVWNGRETIERALLDAGVELLVNQSRALPPPFGEVSICGIDDPWLGRPSVAGAFAGAGSVRIYLMHSPDGMRLAEAAGQGFELGLAGHTHGGQIVSRAGAPLKRPGGRYSNRYLRGRFEMPDSGPLLVSRGIGCSGIPLRVRADPELLICTLR